MKKILSLGAALCIAFTASAQTNSNPISFSTIQSLLDQHLIQYGQPVTLAGQSFVVTTNASGGLNIATYGVGGSASFTPPSTPTMAAADAQQFIANNNPTNRDFYSPSEVVGRLGAVYLQNSGAAVVEIGVEKYGLLSTNVPIGVGAALFQGNQAGKSGTAGAVAFADYRRIIGDVSFQVGAGGGWNNWDDALMGVVKADVEYRQNAHIGEYVGVGYAIEPGDWKNSSKGGLMVRGGINYAF